MKTIFVFGLVLVTSMFGCSNAQRAEQQVSNQEIRDAILSLVHSYTLLENKLERHEQRERGLGEVIKKGLQTIQRNQKLLEPIKGTLTRLEERVSALETILLESEDKTAAQQTRLSDALDGISKYMNSKFIPEKIGEDSSKDFSKDDDLDELGKNLIDLSENVRGLKKDIAELKTVKEISTETSKNLLAQAEMLVNSKLGSADDIISKMTEKLSEFYITTPSTSAPPKHNTEWEENVSKELKDIYSNIINIRSILPETPLPDKEFVHGLANETLEAIEDMKIEALTASDKSFTKTATRIKETNDKLEASMEEVLKTLTEGNNAIPMTTSNEELTTKLTALQDDMAQISNLFETLQKDAESFQSEVSQNLTMLKEDTMNITKMDNILVQTGQNVLDAKRGLDYGIQQILGEIREVVKTHSKELGSIVSKKFETLNNTLLENHSGALSNLSSKIETEISQVWRQIGIMYQEISGSKQALDALQEKTEVYVNGTLTTMDGMEDKVSKITVRMTEVDENLNFLLGRLSLVTQEFNNIKIGLGQALDNIKKSFMEVQEKVKEGPGPHSIEDEEDYNSLNKRDALSLKLN